MLTGDNVHTDGMTAAESEASCQLLGTLCKTLLPADTRLLVIPGNHDRRRQLASAFPPGPQFSVETKNGWLLVGVDTLLEGEAYGVLPLAQREWLDETLRKHPGIPTMLFMHHPPQGV